jgi:hypothetical protein
VQNCNYAFELCMKYSLLFVSTNVAMLPKLEDMFNLLHLCIGLDFSGVRNRARIFSIILKSLLNIIFWIRRLRFKPSHAIKQILKNTKILFYNLLLGFPHGITPWNLMMTFFVYFSSPQSLLESRLIPLSFINLPILVPFSLYGCKSLRTLAAFSVSESYAVGRTPCTGDQPVTRPLPTHRIDAHRYPCLE